MSNTANNKLLTRADLFSMAIGQIIGVGVMTMTGIAIGFTGRSVNIAYIFAGLISICTAIPQIFMGGTANFTGGRYSMIGILSGKKWAGIYTYTQICFTIAVSFFALSFAEYLNSLVPEANGTLVAIALLTVLFGMHFFGIKQAAKLQILMTIILALALSAYVVFGLGHVQPDYFSNGFITAGAPGFIMAVIYLNFATGGATLVVNFSAQAKNPTKDIPFVIVVSTLAVVVIYALIATVSAGVLPVDQVANQPLSVSARIFMGDGLYTFFVIGGAIFALITTLNFSIGMVIMPTMRACEDGWLPKGLATCNKKYGTPHIMLLFFYVIGVTPLLIGIDISTIANSTVILNSFTTLLTVVSAFSLPKKIPEIWNKSEFHVGKNALRFFTALGGSLAGLSALILIVTSSTTEVIINIAILVICTALAIYRAPKVTISASYTEK